jgi:hypothetical protein
MALDADERAIGPRVRTPSSPLAAMRNADTISGNRYRIWGMTGRVVWVPLRFFGHNVAAAVKPEEFGESTIE